MANIMIVPNEFGWVVLGVSAIAVHCMSTSRFVLRARSKHKIEYPDMGSGIYASKLSEPDWISFNNAQRAHGNYLEMMPVILPLSIFSGLFFPKPAAMLCVPFIVGRELYSRGYANSGPKARYRGTPFYMTALLGWLGMSVYGAVNLVMN